MSILLWLKTRVQVAPERPLSPKELLGLLTGLAYLSLVAYVACQYAAIWLSPSASDPKKHRKCVIVSSSMARGSDSAYKDFYALCMKGQL